MRLIIETDKEINEDILNPGFYIVQSNDIKPSEPIVVHISVTSYVPYKIGQITVVSDHMSTIYEGTRAKTFLKNHTILKPVEEMRVR